MGVYHVYTKMAMVPTYVLYRCQKCHHLIAARGSYGFSSSYTDRGTWTQKGVQRRADAATAELETVAGSMQNSLRKHAMVIYDEDFPNIQCTCPKCGHVSLGKLGDIGKINRCIALGLLAVVVIVAVVFGNKLSDFHSVVGLLLVGLVAAGLIRLVCGSVLRMIDKRQRAGILRETAPLISASKECLMNEARKNPTYRDADYSAIEKQPDIL